MKTTLVKSIVVIAMIAIAFSSEAFVSAVAASPQSASDAVIGALDTRGDAYKIEISKWKMTTSTTGNYIDPNFVPDKKWKTATPGTQLLKSDTGTWFWAKYKVPNEIAGVSTTGGMILFYPVVLQSADIYINGSWKGNTYSLQGEFLVTDNANPGEEYTFLIHSYNRYGNGAFLKATLSYIPQEELDREVNTYLNDLKTVRTLIEYAPDKNKWNEIAERSAAAVDLDAFSNKDFDRFAHSIKSARALLDPAKEFTRQFSVYLLGYSHIDLAYRWDKYEGVEVWEKTTRTVLDLLKEYPDWIYCAGQAAGYQYIEKRHPEMFREIKQRVAEGRWEPVGAMWVEPDSNLPGGESFVRQLLYGKRWFRKKFNKDVVVAWTPDSFGFNWNLAQIYKKAGIIGFYTLKMHWNDTTKIPHNIFWWEGPDGSRVLTYLPPDGDALALDTYPVLDHLKIIDKSAGLKETFETFGVGDHGGGVTRTSLNRALAFINDPIFPKTVFTTADAYFKRLVSLSKTLKFPVYKNELYLEYHRGTYTTQAATKRNNRHGEAALADAELFSSIASGFGYKYPRKDIRSAWDILLFNQFHDILPGSSIPNTFRDADTDYAEMFKTAKSATYGAIGAIASNVKTSGSGNALLIFNPLPWPRDAVVSIPNDSTLTNKDIYDDKGKLITSQQVVNSGKNKLLFVAEKLPASGYSVYRLKTKSSSPKNTSETLKITAATIENESLKVTFDPKTGNITSLIDKRTKYEYFGGGNQGNILQCYRDLHEKYDAWNIKLHEELPVTLESPPEIVEAGPVRATLRLTKTIGKSTFVHYVSLVKGIPQVFVRLEVDWKESHVMAKMAFQLNLNNDTAWYEIPYAAIPRATVAKTEADRAKWEVSAQKWVSYSGADGRYGLSILNNGKYGYDTKNNVMRISLLRSPKEPDPEADMKHHTIEFSIYPHVGDWRKAQTPRRGYEFNSPVLSFFEKPHDGPLPASKSFFASEPANVILSAVKLAEDSNSLILRIYEAAGSDSTAHITLPATPKSVQETDLLEEQPKNVKFNKNHIHIAIGHYELKTLKITF